MYYWNIARSARNSPKFRRIGGRKRHFWPKFRKITPRGRSKNHQNHDLWPTAGVESCTVGSALAWNNFCLTRRPIQIGEWLCHEQNVCPRPCPDPIKSAAWIRQIIRQCSLARSISTYNGTILRVDRLYTPCEYETLRAAQEIHQNFDESVAGNVVSEPDFVKSRHVADRRITKIMIYDQQPALGV